MTPTDLANHLRSLDLSDYPLTHQLAISAAVETLRVVPLPVRPRTSWTVLKNLEGRRVFASSGFSAGGAWSWVLDTVAHEHGVHEDRIGSIEDTEEQYDGDDLVTVDGLPVYRIDHFSK